MRKEKPDITESTDDLKMVFRVQRLGLSRCSKVPCQ